MSSPVSSDNLLLETIGELGLVQLANVFGGTRLMIPVNISNTHKIAHAIGLEAARKLGAQFAPDVIKVPLCRELRARHFRAQRLSNAEIALKLGMTETGVELLFKRARKVE